jgi:hypothetical protein
MKYSKMSLSWLRAYLLSHNCECKETVGGKELWSVVGKPDKFYSLPEKGRYYDGMVDMMLDMLELDPNEFETEYKKNESFENAIDLSLKVKPVDRKNKNKPDNE